MGGTSSIAECGSLQLEWCTLSLRTGNEIYAKKALKVFDSIHAAYPDKVSTSYRTEPLAVSGE